MGLIIDKKFNLLSEKLLIELSDDLKASDIDLKVNLSWISGPLNEHFELILNDYLKKDDKSKK